MSLNQFNIDLAQRIQAYQKEVVKHGENPTSVSASRREPRMSKKNSSDYVRPSGEVGKMDEAVLTVNTSKQEASGGSRIKKAYKWKNFSKETASDAIELADKALDVKDKHDMKSQAFNHALKMTGGVNRLKKARKWRDFSKETIGDAIDLGDQAWDVHDKHSMKNQAFKHGLKMTGAGFSKKKLDTAVNKLQNYMEGKSHLKPTKLQYELLKEAGIVEDVEKAKKSVKKAVKAVRGGGAPKQPSAWVQHVMKYSKEHNIPYKEAMSKAKATYKR